MPRSLAITAFLQPNQMVGGVASFIQNLTRGMHQAIARWPEFGDVDVTVLHGPAGVPYRCPDFAYRECAAHGGRFVAETWFGLGGSRQFDAAIFPNYFRPPVVRARRSVVVIHDLLYKHMPELVAPQKRAWLHLAQSYALRRCDAVVTISETVRQDVLRCFGQPWASKVRAIWNPIAFERLEVARPQHFTGGRPYLLAVAVDRPFKNLHTLIRAFREIRAEFSDHCLVLAGEVRSRRPKGRIHARSVAAVAPPTVELVRQLGLEKDVIVTGFVSDEELGALYRDADVFAMPSLFEGFGMPPVEALAMGAPAVVSDIPVLREVTLGLARYVAQPRDPAAFAEALAAVLRNVGAARPAPEAIARVRQQFAPATIARQYLETLFGERRLEPSPVAVDLIADRQS